MNKKQRKEVWLWSDKIDSLQRAAEKKGWSLKKYMEFVLASTSDRLSKSKKK